MKIAKTEMGAWKRQSPATFTLVVPFFSRTDLHTNFDRGKVLYQWVIVQPTHLNFQLNLSGFPNLDPCSGPGSAKNYPRKLRLGPGLLADNRSHVRGYGYH